MNAVTVTGTNLNGVNANVTTLTVGTVFLDTALVCQAVAIQDTCLPSRVATINGMPPDPSSLDFVISGGPGITIVAGTHDISVINSGVLRVGLIVPPAEFTATINNVSSTGDLTIVLNPQLPNTVWAGPASGNTSALPGFRLIVEPDLPLISLVNKVYGTLAVARGGTGSSAVLVGNRVMMSTSFQTIVERSSTGLGELLMGSSTGSYIPGNLVGGYDITVTPFANGTIRIDAQVGVHMVNLTAPTSIFVVTSGSVTDTGVLAFDLINQTARSFWAGPANGTSPGLPTFRPIAVPDLPLIPADSKITGVLPLANGGTGSSVSPLNGNRFMQSASGGGSIVEASALTDGQVFIGSTGGAAVPAQLTGSGGVVVTPSPGAIQVGFTSAPNFVSLGVTGLTTLGTATTCTNPLSPSCIEISNQVCNLGPLANNCIPSNLVIPMLTVQVLNVLNTTNQGDITLFNDTAQIGTLYVGTVYLNESLTCVAGGYIDPGCVDISNKLCPLGPLAESCIPEALFLTNTTLTGTLAVNALVCNGPPIADNCVRIDNKTCIYPISDSCTPLRIGTINGIIPGSLEPHNIDLVAGVGITIANGVAQLTISNSLLTTARAANTFFAGPASGPGTAIPAFRSMVVADLPLLGTENVFFANSGPTNLTTLIAARAVTSVGLTVPSIFGVSGSPITSTGVIAVTLNVQAANRVFAAPSGVSGIPGFRNLVAADMPTEVLTSVGLTAPSAEFAVSGSPAVGPSGTLVITKQVQSPNMGWFGPALANASAAAPTFRRMVPADHINLNLTLGQFLGGTTGLGGLPVPTDIIAGSGIIINKTNGGVTISASINASNIGTVTSISISTPGTLFTVSPTTITTSGTFTLVPNVQAANRILASPNGASGYPTIRSMVLADLPVLGVDQIYIGDGSALTSISTLNAGGAISIVNAANVLTISTTFSVGLALPGSVFSIAGSPVTTTGTLTGVFVFQTPNTIFAGPATGPAGDVPTFRSMVLADLPALGDGQMYIGSSGTGVPVAGTIAAGAGIIVTPGDGTLTISTAAFGTVTSVALALPSSIFSVSGSPVTGSGTLTGTLVSQLASRFFAAPVGASGVPVFRAMALADLPALTNGQLYIGSTGNPPVTAALVAGSGIAITIGAGSITISAAAGTGTVTSVALALPAVLFTVSGSPVTTSGTLTGTLATQTANRIFAGPASGSAAAPTFRAAVNADLPTLTSGQLFIGSTGVAPVSATLTAGSGITITNGAGSITIAANTAGTVTSVALALPVSIFSISGSPVTSSGTLTGSLVTQSANFFFAGPVSGSAAAPTFRGMVNADLPALTNGQIYIGSTGVAPVSATLTAGPGITITSGVGSITIATAAGGGTVTSVALALPSSVFSVSGSPVTTTGTLTGSFATQTANFFFAGPVSGAVATPAFRGMVNADLPALTNGQLYIGSTGVAPVSATLTAGSGITITNAAGSITIAAAAGGGTVTSVALSLPSIFSVSGSPVTTSGTLTGTLATQAANLIFAGPGTGAAAVPTFRSIVNADLPALTDGQLFIGSTAGVAPVSATLTAGSGIAITNGAGSITISATVGGGTVTSVALTLPSSVFTVTGSPITTAGTIDGAFATQLANRIFAGPTTGGAVAPTFRAMVAADVPSLDTSKLTTGILPIARGGTNSGTAITANRIMVSTATAIVVGPALTNGQLLVGSTGATPVAASITGTTNRIIVSLGAGTINLSGPQDIHTAASPTFASMALTATSSQLIFGTTATTTLSTTAPSASRVITIHDAGANSNVVLNTGGALTITNTPAASGYVALATSSSTASWQAPSALAAVLAPGISQADFDNTYCLSDDYIALSPVLSATDFMLTSAMTYHYAFAGAGPGISTVNTFNSPTSGMRAFGVLAINSGTDQNSRAVFYTGDDDYTTGYAQLDYTTRVRFASVMSSPERWRAYFGFIDMVTLAGEPNDGIFFQTDYTVSTTNWLLRTRNNGAVTTVITTVAISSSNFQKLAFTINSAGTSVTGFIDGVNIGSISTNIPTGAGRQFTGGVKLEKTMGNTPAIAYIDYNKWCSTFAGSR